MKKLGAVAVAAIAALALGACGSDESREDANDVLNGQVDKSSPYVSGFNNHFPNLQHKCLTEGARGKDTSGRGVGLRAVVTSDGHGSRLVVIPDPHCAGYVPEQAGIRASEGNAP